MIILLIRFCNIASFPAPKCSSVFECCCFFAPHKARIFLFILFLCQFHLFQAAEYIPEKVKKAEKKLEENPYDLDAWSILIREAQV